MNKIIEIENLNVHFETREGTVRALRGVNFAVNRGETLGIVGESGCGKSVTAQSMLQILPKHARIVGGTIHYYPDDGAGESQEGIDIVALGRQGKGIRDIRGRQISIVFQEPMTSLSPVHTIGNQIGEIIRIHCKVDAKKARAEAIDLLRRVGIPKPELRVDSYTFELSGGMRQRVMIAMALACRPKLLIADEPTTALDVTIQAQILELLRDLQEDLGMTVVIITHNLGVISNVSTRVAVMYLGHIVELAPTVKLFNKPLHPYTQGLLKSVPILGGEVQERLWAIKGVVPHPFSKVPGCPFYPRCTEMIKGLCDKEIPRTIEIEPGHQVSCHLYPEKEGAASE